MIQIMVVTHGRFGVELVRSAELIVGKQEGIEAFGLEKKDNIKNFGEEIYHIIEDKISQGHEVIVLTDLFGGSPSNVILANLKRAKFRCITGVNLPMLIEAINQRMEGTMTLNKLADICETTGKEGINNVSIDLFTSK